MTRAPHSQGGSALVAAAIAVVGAISHASTLQAGFSWDDRRAVIQNADVAQPDTTLAQIARHDFWGDELAGQPYLPQSPSLGASARAVL